MRVLFQPYKLGNLELPNRIVRSATYDGMAYKTGHVSARQIDLYESLAAGGVGLIITGITYVHPSGQISSFQNSIADDDYIDGFKKLTQAVHERGAKIAVQLFHAGREAHRFLKPKKMSALAPSFIEQDAYFKGEYEPFAEDQIWEIVTSFGDAARRAREAGFDAVQIHGAHAYLLSQFLSPYTNKRRDKWGGPLENRIRFHHEILRDIKKKAGTDYPVLLKLGVQDGFREGLRFAEGKLAALNLARAGFDALEISQGLRGRWYSETEFRTHIRTPHDEAYFRNWCKEIKSSLTIPVPLILVGGLRSPDIIEEILLKHEADLISLCRPLIREPGIINAWKGGSNEKSQCISCNKCLEKVLKGKPLACEQVEGGGVKSRGSGD